MLKYSLKEWWRQVAKVKMLMPDDYLERLSKLGAKTDNITKKVLKVGGKEAEKTVETELNAVIGKDLKRESRSTGRLLESLGVSKPLMDRDGNYNVKVGFSQTRIDGGNNALIASVIEYGKSGQPAKPFMARAKRKCKKRCEAAMIKEFEKEVNKI